MSKTNRPVVIDGKEITVSGRFPKIARLRVEYYEHVADPHGFIEKARAGKVKADLLTFLQNIGDSEPKYKYYHELDSLAVIFISTYEQWWTGQLKDKTRNMVRKAKKKGVEIRVVEFDDELVRGIVNVYNESPLRQGKPFKHYGKDFDTIKRDHISFLDRSDFIGAYYNDELIGFIKLVHGDGYSSLMQIISMISHRDKAPSNALVAKAVEICAERKVPFLHYGVWSKRGLGDFKRHHAFNRLYVPRYYIPLNLRGRLALKIGLQNNLATFLPPWLVEVLIKVRSKWNSFSYRSRTA